MNSNKADELLRVESLSVELGGRRILDNVSFKVKEGEMLGIVGVSGVGKTTLLNSIIGYYSRKSGNVLYKSVRTKRFISVLDNLDNFKKLFGFSAQTPSFYPELTILENLEYFASLYDMPENIKKLNIRKILQLVKLREHTKALAKNLSGGMKKRLDIACALVHNPLILILDEPTSDMDPLLTVHIWNLLEDINESGTTVLVASHFLSEVENNCDRMVFLRDGRAEFIGSPKNFRQLYSKIKEIHIKAEDGKYDLILRKVKNMPFLEVKHVYKKSGILIHSLKTENALRHALSSIESEAKNISDIEIRNPSMDMLFRLFAKK